MAGSGQVRDEALRERWERSLVGVTGSPVRRRRRRSERGRGEPSGGLWQRDSNRLPTERPGRRRLAVSALAVGAGLLGVASAVVLAPAGSEPTALVCPAGVTASWVDRYRDVLGLQVPDPRDHLEVAASAGSRVEVSFTDAAGARYPEAVATAPGGGVLVVDPPRPVPADERARWRVQVVVTSGTAAAVCAGALR